MKFIITLAIFGITINCFAQKDSTWGIITDSNTVIVHKDARIDLLLQKQAKVNEKAIKESKRTGKGYRLMIISTKSRDEAVAARTKIFTLFPDLRPILYHQSPYFKVKAGSFEDREDAEDYRIKLNRYFPNGVNIMTDTIEINPKKNSDDD